VVESRQFNFQTAPSNEIYAKMKHETIAGWPQDLQQYFKTRLVELQSAEKLKISQIKPTLKNQKFL
jgi:hypothetical protein